MNAPADRFAELQAILDAICEDRLTNEQAARLDELFLNDAAARRHYLEYIDLHGNLHWDAAQGHFAGAEADSPRARRGAASHDRRATTAVAEPVGGRWRSPAQKSRSTRLFAALFGTLAVGLVALSLWMTRMPPRPEQSPKSVVAGNEAIKPIDSAEFGAREKSRAASAPVAPKRSPPRRPVAGRESAVTKVDAASPARARAPSDPIRRIGNKVTKPVKSTVAAPATTEDLDRRPLTLVEFVNGRIRDGWKNADVEPSPIAADGEWLRRVYLDVVGHIPPEEVVNEFVDNGGEQKRAAVVERLLKEPDFPRHWATVWANLLVGRRPRSGIASHEALEKFLRDNFAANTPWNEIIYELVSAEGNSDENPAANFLLAHLNNDAVPATALTARLFLGIQVQCTQCHDHPFQSDKQNRFWELNSFFQQTEMVSHAGTTAGSAMGTLDDGTAGQPAGLSELVTRKVGGPMYYETRRGEMRAVFPVYAGHKIDPSPTVNRRRELARLIAKGDDRQLALAMVNRTWQHFLGYGFTRPVDDMGPHNPPTHPEVLNRLAKEFVASGYDLKQLIRWICATDAYQRASTMGSGNSSDDPTSGAAPLFTHVYLKPMSAEQLYDSLLLATRAKSSARTDWNDVGRRRQDWVRQFVYSYGTDDNDEATVPAASVSQALTMMNDRIVEGALTVEPGTLLYDVAQDMTDDDAKVRRLCRAALSRDPTAAELEAALGHLQDARALSKSGKERERAEAKAIEDIFWAYLNANEFALVH